MFCDDSFDAGVAALFFVVIGQENYVALERNSVALERNDRGEIRDDHALVVNRAAAVEIAALSYGGERIYRPFFASDADNIQMREK